MFLTVVSGKKKKNPKSRFHIQGHRDGGGRWTCHGRDPALTWPSFETVGCGTSLLSGSAKSTTVAAVVQENPGKTVYTLGRGSDTYINFYRYSGKNLAANKAFLLVGGNNAKAMSLSFDGEATGIKTLDTVVDDGAWYTVEGIKLQGAPTRKGMYIHHKKKVAF